MIFADKLPRATDTDSQRINEQWKFFQLNSISAIDSDQYTSRLRAAPVGLSDKYGFY